MASSSAAALGPRWDHDGGVGAAGASSRSSRAWRPICRHGDLSVIEEFASAGLITDDDEYAPSRRRAQRRPSAVLHRQGDRVRGGAARQAPAEGGGLRGLFGSGAAPVAGDEEVLGLAMDRLAVELGLEIVNLVPGVSTEVDIRASLTLKESLRRAPYIIAMSGRRRAASRVLIKLAGTWEDQGRGAREGGHRATSPSSSASFRRWPPRGRVARLISPFGASRTGTRPTAARAYPRPTGVVCVSRMASTRSTATSTICMPTSWRPSRGHVGPGYPRQPSALAGVDRMTPPPMLECRRHARARGTSRPRPPPPAARTRRWRAARDWQRVPPRDERRRLRHDKQRRHQHLRRRDAQARGRVESRVRLKYYVRVSASRGRAPRRGAVNRARTPGRTRDRASSRLDAAGAHRRRPLRRPPSYASRRGAAKLGAAFAHRRGEPAELVPNAQARRRPPLLGRLREGANAAQAPARSSRSASAAHAAEEPRRTVAGAPNARRRLRTRPSSIASKPARSGSQRPRCRCALRKLVGVQRRASVASGGPVRGRLHLLGLAVVVAAATDLGDLGVGRQQAAQRPDRVAQP